MAKIDDGVHDYIVMINLSMFQPGTSQRKISHDMCHTAKSIKQSLMNNIILFVLNPCAIIDLSKSKKENNELRSLRGLWKDFNISISRKDIAELRAEMWNEREILLNKEIK